MGVDLKLLPMEYVSSNNVSSNNGKWWGYSNSALELRRGRNLWKWLRDNLQVSHIPEGADFSSFVTGKVPDGSAEGETMYGTVGKTPYGDRATWVRAHDLAKVMSDYSVSATGLRADNSPAIAYLNLLPEETMVILWWH
jgi:hypothetical protein